MVSDHGPGVPAPGAFVRALYKAYVRSPLHPHAGALIKRLLRLRNRLAGIRQVVHQSGDVRIELDLDLLIDNAIYQMGTWEPDVVAAINRHLVPGGVAVDIGAHTGFMTLQMARAVGPSGRVFAFEPTTWAFERLERNLALNFFAHVTPIRAALGDRAELIDTVVPTSYPLVGPRPTTRETITIETLDAYWSTHGGDRLDLIKCDTDGWEAHVFRGGEQTLRRFRPVLLFEINPSGLAARGASVDVVVRWLSDLGYRISDPLTGQPIDVAAASRGVSSQHDIDVVALPLP